MKSLQGVPKQSRTRWLLIGCSALIAIAILCTCAAFAVSTVSPSTPTPAETLRPTFTPIPTETPMPVILPTWTPMLTVVPTDTLTTEGPSPEVAMYLLEMPSKLQVLSDCLFDLGRLLSVPRFDDENWTFAVAANMLVIQEIHRELTEMTVPPEMAEIHAAVLDATGDFSKSMDYLTTGLGNMSVEDINMSTSLMSSGNEKIQKATEMLKEKARRQSE